jgi:uncharacterized coiled-coil DUF342 family protein
MTHDELLNSNMEMAGVIRALRANAREDAATIERLTKERDEAREAATEQFIAAGKAANERDEAREALTEETKFHNRTHAELVQVQCTLMDVRAAMRDLWQFADQYLPEIPEDKAERWDKAMLEAAK